MRIDHDFLDLDEQVAHLISRGVNVGNVQKTRDLLDKNSFFRVINGYRKPFLEPGPSRHFLNGVKFDEIYSLYKFDRELRDWTSPFILEIENTIKTEIIYAFSNHKDAFGNLLRGREAYLDISNYDTDGGTNPRKITMIYNLVNKLREVKSKFYEYSPAFQHYEQNYGYIPLWVLTTQITFGEISSFYQCMIPSDRQAVSKKYHLTDSQMMTILQVLTLARNCCAHGNRFYCFRFNYTLPLPKKVKYPVQYDFLSRRLGQNNLFGVFLCLKYLIDPRRFSRFMNQIDDLVSCLTKHLKTITADVILDIMGFPPDWREIKKIEGK